MRLLIITQTVDKDDAVLGFMHGWLEEFATHFDALTVICLREGQHTLSRTMRIHSLGKEKGKANRLTYGWRFLRYVWSERYTYDAVLVHMNQEYILLAGLVWKLLGKRVYLWRNHYAGSLVTDVAAAFCTQVFCTSKFSYTARYKKNVLMPVGIDTELFKPKEEVLRAPRSILFLGRITPSKRPEVLLEALGLLRARSEDFIATVCGPGEGMYIERLKAHAQELGIAESVRFISAIPQRATPDLYNANEIFVNLSPSGMYDKTMFEAASCDTVVFALSKDWAQEVDRRSTVEEATPESVASGIEMLLNLPEAEKASLIRKQRELVSKHSLAALGAQLASYIR